VSQALPLSIAWRGIVSGSPSCSRFEVKGGAVAVAPRCSRLQAVATCCNASSARWRHFCGLIRLRTLRFEGFEALPARHVFREMVRGQKSLQTQAAAQTVEPRRLSFLGTVSWLRRCTHAGLSRDPPIPRCSGRNAGRDRSDDPKRRADWTWRPAGTSVRVRAESFRCYYVSGSEAHCVATLAAGRLRVAIPI